MAMSPFAELQIRNFERRWSFSGWSGTRQLKRTCLEFELRTTDAISSDGENSTR